MELYTLCQNNIEIEVQTKRILPLVSSVDMSAIYTKQVTTDNKEEWSIESVTVRSVGIPDKDKTISLK